MKEMGKIRHGKIIDRSMWGVFGGGGRVEIIYSIVSQKLRSLWH